MLINPTMRHQFNVIPTVVGMTGLEIKSRDHQVWKQDSRDWDKTKTKNGLESGLKYYNTTSPYH